MYNFSVLSQADAILQVQKEIKSRIRQQDSFPLSEQSLPRPDQEISNSIWDKHTQKLKKNSDGGEFLGEQKYILILRCFHYQ